MIQTILISVITTLAGCAIGYFLTRIINKLRVFLIRESDEFAKSKKRLDEFHIKRFYNTFGFYYEDVIKYAPELDEFISGQTNPNVRNRVVFKMLKMHEIYEAISEVEQIDVMMFKRAIENTRTQKTLENIDG